MIYCPKCGPDKIWIQWACSHLTYACQYCGHFFSKDEIERHNRRAAIAKKRGEKNVVDAKNFFYSDQVDNYGFGCRAKR